MFNLATKEDINVLYKALMDMLAALNKVQDTLSTMPKKRKRSPKAPKPQED